MVIMPGKNTQFASKLTANSTSSWVNPFPRSQRIVFSLAPPKRTSARRFSANSQHDVKNASSLISVKALEMSPEGNPRDLNAALIFTRPHRLISKLDRT
jgi:hypothetical protein